ncbi:MAG: hypothetical protein JWN85_1190 [Gammaproteobacteria bacterium]|nr:hypothetical protein [Gammaproteobacteria bacterium]
MDRLPTQNAESGEGAAAPQAGTAEIVASLSARFRVPLQRFFAKRQIPRDDVDDLVQDVFVRLASRPNFESTERLEAYLFTTAANLLNDRYRRQIFRATHAHVPFDEGLHAEFLETDGPERSLLATQVVAQLVEALFELPARTRAIFVLYHFEDYPHAEIAKKLGIAVSTIEKHMARANAHLVTRMAGL